MHEVNRIDVDGMFVEPIVLEDGETLTEPITNEDGSVTFQPRTDIITVPVPEGFHHPKWNGSEWVEGKTDAELLAIAKANKIIEIKQAADADLKTFQSSALGTVHTYLSEENDMLLLTGEYSFVKGSDYDNSDILWYTIENGNISHTGEQFIQLYLDARAHVQTVKYQQATLEADAEAAASMADVNAISW